MGFVSCKPANALVFKRLSEPYQQKLSVSVFLQSGTGFDQP